MCFNRTIPLVGPPPQPRPDEFIPRRWWDVYGHGAECDLAIVVDHTFYQQRASRNVGVAVSVVMQHVALADFVFRSTDMVNLDSLPDNIGFSITDIFIYPSENSPKYRLKDVSLDRHTIINQFSGYNFDDYCLAIAFTHRDLGLLLSSLRLSASASSLPHHRHSKVFSRIFVVRAGVRPG